MAKETATIRALKIINAHEITMPSQFGRFMWPDNPGWQRNGKSGNGQAKGVGMRLASGAFLGKLQQRGLIRYGSRMHPYALTQEGKTLLDKWCSEREKPD